MSSLAWLIIIVLILTVLGSLTLLFITTKFYWGERGAPPLSREQRRILREQKEKES